MRGQAAVVGAGSLLAELGAPPVVMGITGRHRPSGADYASFLRWPH